MTVQNYLTRKTASAAPLVLEVLDFCGEWRKSADVLAAFSSYPRTPLRRLLSALVSQTFLERSRGVPARDDRPLAKWDAWTPAAAFFHFATKDVRYDTQEAVHGQLTQKAVTQPAPPPVKAYASKARIALPATNDSLPLADVLRSRRTWRQFGNGSTVDIGQVATLLGLTWGVQGWAQGELGPCALKTSPSGGARHPTEAYLFVRAVKGLAAGCYYYDPDAHALVLVKRGLSAAQLEAYLAGQSCYANVPAIVVMTAVFPRMQWRYEFPRAYRVVLLDAGHLCQTFCLVATALGLAPFCTAALADTLVERDLGIDGVNESVIYACGVGTRPDGVAWAPWPDTGDIPAVLPPKSNRNRNKS
jgi:SagB-type dehydrogenase family enzyme